RKRQSDTLQFDTGLGVEEENLALAADAHGHLVLLLDAEQQGHRELYGSDFSWVVGEWLQDIKRPEALMVLERREWGNFYGYLL
ncbi:hypothetical protein CJT55_31730, partial [Pseudomonas aeruginosa]